MEKVRIDKWLWAARFFKTRSMAAQAVNGGKVHLNGQRAKAARLLGPGDRLEIHKGEYEFVLTVRQVASRRLSAPLAAELYEEDPASQAKRQELIEQRRLARKTAPQPPAGRPGKRDRRLIKRFIRKSDE
ncbi:RNA-binding S4 domain-containing protein [Desulfurivibrio alkaliphilus]|uniref:RNA-binding S4 domain protein n=1 Tax=Desulfurivibrio alkaliphilus (strain DSM 19089 / UNIQEM U267 / AHT2) TaxID=589865 RepID=D6Z0H6_DESAT|nr:S4 domain-containing protein [Desulfurivibrio alkaliphilus]ADH85205.1 RNA-binding S4 domain protein [Desulfurivibrio alkaliphilus AHT 2]